MRKWFLPMELTSGSLKSPREYSQDKPVYISNNVGEIALGNMQSKNNKDEEIKRSNCVNYVSFLRCFVCFV